MMVDFVKSLWFRFSLLVLNSCIFEILANMWNLILVTEMFWMCQRFMLYCIVVRLSGLTTLIFFLLKFCVQVDSRLKKCILMRDLMINASLQSQKLLFTSMGLLRYLKTKMVSQGFYKRQFFLRHSEWHFQSFFTGFGISFCLKG